MKNRKQELRGIVLDIIQDKEKVEYPPNQFPHLKIGVAEILERREGVEKHGRLHDPKLSDSDAMIVMEIFWDLVVEKIITIGLNACNADYPWFRLHSEAAEKLKPKNHSKR